MLTRICVTGANGFIGGALCSSLNSAGYKVVRAVRTALVPSETEVGNISGATNWVGALTGCATVVHLAARVHVMRDSVVNPHDIFREINVEGTLHLASQAALLGVRRFVYLSSIKVNGEGRQEPYGRNDQPLPQNPYAVSKWEAEIGLQEIASKTGMEVVILRPPLVYGPGVRANFARLIRLVSLGVPLPFGQITNRRSLLFLGNLVDAIYLCLSHPLAANRTYLLSDGEDVSTPDLVRRLAISMGKPCRLLPVPASLFTQMGRVFRKELEVKRLLGSLTVDNSAIQNELGWKPPYTLDQGLVLTVNKHI